MLTTNQIKEISKLKLKKHREISKKFLIEGEHLIEECIKSKIFAGRIEIVIANTAFKNQYLLDRLSKKNIAVEFIKGDQFNKISETENSQGIIAVVESPAGYNNEFPEGLTIALENINDPGNLGTILRTAWWFGVNNVILGKNSVDLLNSKTIRASQGAVFNVNVIQDIDLKEFLSSAINNKFEVILTTLDSGNLISGYRYNKGSNVIIVFGNEANGISPELKSIPLLKNLKINGYSDCESLNIAQSVAIFLYHFKSVN